MSNNIGPVIQKIINLAEVTRDCKARFIEQVVDYQKHVSMEILPCVSYMEPINGGVEFSICERRGIINFEMPSESAPRGSAFILKWCFDGSQDVHHLYVTQDFDVLESPSFEGKNLSVGTLVEHLMIVLYKNLRE